MRMLPLALAVVLSLCAAPNAAAVTKEVLDHLPPEYCIKPEETPRVGTSCHGGCLVECLVKDVCVPEGIDGLLPPFCIF